MNFANVRIITDDVPALTHFYHTVLGIKPVAYSEDYTELETSSCTLAIGSSRSMAMYGAGAARPASNYTAILEFQVEDLDKEFARLKSVVEKYELEPTTQPWGNRSMLFRDPDGNLINFFAQVRAPATSDPVANGRHDDTKTVIVTGANAGIGFAAAELIARRSGWHVVLACRNQEKAESAIEKLSEKDLRSSVSFLPLDLFSLDSVKNFAVAFQEQELPPLHGLILNAGGINMKAKSLEFTKDGFEHIFQLNFLGHFLLTSLLIGKMDAASRVVFVSSDLHDPAATNMGKFAPPRFGPVEDAAYGRGIFTKMNPMARYGTAKMFAMMCAREFDRRLRSGGKPAGITINSWSPGVVPTTQAGRSLPALQRKIMMSGAFVKFMGSHLSTEYEAAQALGGLIMDEKFAGVGGRYFDGTKEILSSAESRDDSKARSVWEQARKLAKTDGRRIEPAIVRQGFRKRPFPQCH